VGSVVAILCGLGVLIVEDKDNQRTGRVRDSMDDDIRFLRVDLVLKRDHSFRDLLPASALFEFAIPNNPMEIGFRAYATNMITGRGEVDGNRTISFMVETAMFSERGIQCGYGFAQFETNSSRLSIPIRIRKGTIDVRSIRDLKWVQFVPALSSSLLRDLKEILVVANDLVVLRIAPDSREWEQLSFTSPPLDNARPAILLTPRGRKWVIDLNAARELDVPNSGTIPELYSFYCD